jgi:DNA-binding GntR family transcriptional regulator
MCIALVGRDPALMNRGFIFVAQAFVEDGGISVKSKTETAYAHLEQGLLDGTYVPGYRIVISQLVRETGISAIPWREAIRQLEAEGWLEMVHNVGARVATFDTGAYEHSVEIVARLEGYATAAASSRLDDGALAEAGKINGEMIEALENFDPARFSTLNREFHCVFYDHCGDDHLRKLIANELNRSDLIRRTVFASVPERAHDSVEEHKELIRLLERRAPFDEIERVARQHKLNLLQALKEHEQAARG